MQSGVKTIILTKSEIRMRSKDKKLFNPEKLQKINAINFFLPFIFFIRRIFKFSVLPSIVTFILTETCVSKKFEIH